MSANLSFHPSAPGSGSSDRPLVLLYSWLVAKAKHMHKFGNFYLREGCDVLHIKLSPAEFLWPVKAHGVVKDILDFANTECPTQPLIAHGFSVGCYLYAETLVSVLEDENYRQMAGRIRAQILDSPVDFQGVPFGVANVLTTQPILRKAIELSLRSYLGAFKEQVARHYEHASNTITANELETPTLLLYSHGDVVASVERNEAAMKEWRERGIVIHGKCWQDSKHVEHYLKYPTEYIDALATFLREILKTDQVQQLKGISIAQ